MRCQEAAEVEYLELCSEGLGRRFPDEIRRAESLIARLPEAGEEIRPRLRERVLRKFRYSLIYTIEKEEPLILAVPYDSSRPGYWAGHLHK